MNEDGLLIATMDHIQFEDIFDINEIQRLQDLFSDANGVASIITKPDGTPITQPSNFCRLCSNIIRATDKGRAHCFRSDAFLGQHHPAGPLVRPCLSVGLMDAGASISIEGRHLANWLIGQVRNEDLEEEKLLHYADEIGADREEFMKALKEVPAISMEQFKKISNLLFAFANELSEKAYINWQLKSQIADLKKQKSLVQDREYFFKASQKAAMIGSFKYNYAEGYCESSEIFDQILGVEEGYDHSLQEWLDFIHPDDREMMAKYAHEEIKLKLQPLNKECRIVRRSDGKTRWVLGLGNTLLDSENNIVAFVGTLQDITERKETEAQNMMLRHSLDVYADGIYWMDNENIFVYVNEAGARAFGCKPQDLLGKSLYDVNPTTTPETLADLWHELRTSGTFTAETVHRRPDGTEFYVEVRTVYFQYNGKEYNNGYARDITERKLIEKELIKAKEKAEESDRLKTAFLQNMSHEIRTPMNAIVGFSEILLSNYGDRSKVEYFIGIINHRCADLLVIIDDILDIAKIESGQLPIHLDECDVNVLLEELRIFFSEHQVKLQKEHIEFTIQSLCDPADLTIFADKVKLKQIMINLIGNAFKYTENGSVRVGCKADSNSNLIFFVSDTGVGIPIEKQQVIFERFIQIEPANNYLFGGKGLGLAIAKGLAELLGGRLWLESEVSRGTTFYFSVPYQVYSVPKADFISVEKKYTSCSLHDKTILVVEDDIYNAEYIREVLSKTGLNILYARYGKEAIQIVFGQSIDLVLMDIGLPDISGYDAARQIKQIKPNLKIIAQTAFVSSGDRYKAMESGCIDYIGKPIKSKLLLSLISKHLS
jgi:PAS domain S-box-containing protein